MGDLINLRRARKAMARRKAEQEGERNRIAHGTPKSLRETMRTENERAARAHDNLRRERVAAGPKPPGDQS